MCLWKKRSWKVKVQSAHKRIVMPKKVSLSSPESILTHSHSHMALWTQSFVLTGILTKPLDG